MNIYKKVKRKIIEIQFNFIHNLNNKNKFNIRITEAFYKPKTVYPKKS